MGECGLRPGRRRGSASSFAGRSAYRSANCKGATSEVAGGTLGSLFHTARRRVICVLSLLVLLLSVQTAEAASPAATRTPAQSAAAPASSRAAPDNRSVTVRQAGSQALVVPRATASSTNVTNREVFGYATAGSLGDSTVGYPSWNFDLLSTVAFFAIRVNYKGVLIADSDWNVWDSSTLTGLVTTAHQHGVKVVVTLREGSGDPIDFCNMLYNGQTTVNQIVNQVRLKGIDGVNIDYEGQLTQCAANPPLVPKSNQALLTEFAKNMRAGLDALTPGLYLSIATYSGSASGTDGFFNIPDLNLYVDSFFVMAYDMDYANQGSAPLNCSSFCMAPVSPLTNYYWNDTISMTQYAAVVGAGKTILGLPYYGRVACVASPSAHATATGAVIAPRYLDAAAVINSSDVRPGTYSINRDPNDPTGLDRWDAWYDTYQGCWREMHWLDTTTLGARYNLVNQLKLRGAGIWTLNYGGGAPELWNTLRSYFVSCSGATLTGNPATPQLSGTQVQLVATTSGCINPLYKFWFLPPGGTWTLVQNYTSSPNFYWDTSGYKPGTYRFSVWAKDANSPGLAGSDPNTYDSFSASDYVLTTSPCTAASAAASPVSPTAAGYTITITGSTTGCPGPRYQFWVLPSGGAWTVAQPYSSSATFAWNTTGSQAGPYRISVWARDNSSLGTGGSSPNTYDAFAVLPYSLTMPSCSATTATTAPTTSADLGTTVTVTASAAGCPNPLYAFWLLPPGGTWKLFRGYSSSPTLSWNTAGYPPGSYRFSVWARDIGSPNAYDSFSAFPYSLTTSPCAAMSASAMPPTPTTVGTQVTVTGSATGCPNALYQFWLLAPGGGWTLAQAYSSSATYTWTTAGKVAGSYRFSVWARDTSSSTSYDTFSAFDYSLTIVPCTGMSASAAPPTTATVGTQVTVAASATGCPKPVYQFWVLSPGGSWTIAQPYGSSNTLTWNTAGKATGTYRFSVWARDASSSSSYDAFSAFPYTLS